MNLRSKQRGFIMSPYRYPAGSANFSNITLLTHLDGANGGSTFTDNGPLARTISPGNVTTSTTQSKFGGASAFFSGTNTSLNVTYVSSPIGTGDFTIEYWQYPTSIASDYNPFAVNNSGSSVNVFIGNDSSVNNASMRFCIRNDAQTSNVDITANGTYIVVNTWQHIACVADGSTARIYIDGVQRASGAITGTRTATFTALNLGLLTPTTPRRFAGYLDEVRVTKGVCRYPNGTTFTPQTAAFPDS